MTIIFRIVPHLISPDRVAVAISDENGALLATLYATSDRHLRVISKHLDTAALDATTFPPVVNIMLKART